MDAMDDASGSAGATPAETNQMVLDNLLPALLQTFLLVLLGAATGWWQLMPPAAGDTLGAYTSKFALPALIIKQMAALDLGDCSVGLLAGMLLAKLAVGALVGTFLSHFSPISPTFLSFCLIFLPRFAHCFPHQYVKFRSILSLMQFSQLSLKTLSFFSQQSSRCASLRAAKGVAGSAAGRWQRSFAC